MKKSQKVAGEKNSIQVTPYMVTQIGQDTSLLSSQNLSNQSSNQKVAEQNYCKYCDYTSCKSNDFAKHLLTRKHQLSANLIHVRQKSHSHHLCSKCNVNFKSKSGLWYHKSKCTKTHDVTSEQKNETYGQDTGNTVSIMNNDNLTQLFVDSIKQNQEFQKQMFELLKDNIGGNNNTINSNNNTTNNQFNLQFFLNETCKDAMNINDFIDYVKVKLEDFEHFGDVGYPKALGDIIVRNLNELDVTIRPIHCSDLKREVLYIKHDGVWHNDERRDFMKRSIMYIAHKNIKQIPEWQEENPESKDCQSKTFERYNKMFRASLGASCDEEKDDFLRKITGIVAKEVVIDKKKKY